jgi:hypothetical protein
MELGITPVKSGKSTLKTAVESSSAGVKPMSPPSKKRRMSVSTEPQTPTSSASASSLSAAPAPGLFFSSASQSCSSSSSLHADTGCNSYPISSSGSQEVFRPSYLSVGLSLPPVQIPKSFLGDELGSTSSFPSPQLSSPLINSGQLMSDAELASLLAQSSPTRLYRASSGGSLNNGMAAANSANLSGLDSFMSFDDDDSVMTSSPRLSGS